MSLANVTVQILTEAKSEESAATVASSVTKPRKKIATLKVCFLEDNARSMNGRIYPKSTVDRIVASAIRKLADQSALPITCFVSHETANSNVNTELVGKVTKVWREGTKIYAMIDLADTRAGRDMLALAEGGYLLSESLRVIGVELVQDRHNELPLVMVIEGMEPELLGIDLTTRPGLMDTARIQQVLYESQAAAPYTESFAVDEVTIESKEDQPMSQIPLYLKVILEEGVTPDRQAHQKIHDHLAGVMDECVAPMHGSESARLRALVEAELSEEGRALAMKHATRIAAAHDASAQACGMECEGCYKEALGIPLDPDQDNDAPNMNDQDSEESQKGQDTMTEAEMLEALKAKGYTVAAPKTAEEQLAELRGQIEEQHRQIEALKVAPPQRQTQAPSAMTETGGYAPEEIYEEGEYLAGPLKPATWKSLSNRKVPWPKDVDPKVALHELAPFMAYRLIDQEAQARGRDISSIIEPYERV
jgi:hypothetical protein